MYKVVRDKSQPVANVVMLAIERESNDCDCHMARHFERFHSKHFDEETLAEITENLSRHSRQGSK
jgi:hypothetical protein